MKEIKGKFNNIKIFNDVIEETALNQLQDIADNKNYEGVKIRIMPDVHAGNEG